MDYARRCRMTEWMNKFSTEFILQFWTFYLILGKAELKLAPNCNKRLVVQAIWLVSLLLSH